MKKILFCLWIGASLSQSCINDNEDPVAVAPFQGAIGDPKVGGATEPNQVWIDLSEIDPVTKGPVQTLTKRTDWDLAFYSGAQFKVVLNSSIMMAAAKIPNVTDISQVTEAMVSTLKTQVQVANFNPANEIYIDDVKGDFPNGYTAIEKIEAIDSQNAVYLVNMGKEINAGPVPVGSVATGGDSRGWKIIQIVRAGEGYKVKYGDIAGENYVITVNKNAAYNYNFVSLKDKKEITIQPEKKKWDLCFTVFTNTITGAGSYIFADFVTTNNVGGTGAYEVVVPAPASGLEAYNNFKTSDIDQSKFIYNDQRVIGANWRNPVGANGLEVYGDRFYIIKDANGFYFKLRFTRLIKADADNQGVKGERGFPSFEYKSL
ncbi:HmuY family protein [Chryseobacterium sp. SSA4.19]|uniref:HmuY family protein n=1 Tax=Chryseobacterium sp. SSA4.19 TaxID=2919915 RepID=UPI001F4E61C7|nr:HmuY family protein [Chryseobacterium sp. SSA4.19]MCJ8153815.1 HmuY family protein [Chryseobacterium sp. SSA4.19]